MAVGDDNDIWLADHGHMVLSRRRRSPPAARPRSNLAPRTEESPAHPHSLSRTCAARVRRKLVGREDTQQEVPNSIKQHASSSRIPHSLVTLDIFPYPPPYVIVATTTSYINVHTYTCVTRQVRAVVVCVRVRAGVVRAPAEARTRPALRPDPRLAPRLCSAANG